MSRVRPWIATLAGLTLLFGLTAGPLLQVSDTHAQEAVELRVWDQFTDPEESVVADAIYAAFTEANPNITITREAFETDQMRDTVNTAISSGTGPDVIFYDAGPGYAGILVEAELLLPLTDYAAEYGWTEEVSPSAQEGTTIDGVFYGMPLQTDLIGMYSNETLIAQEGLTTPTTLDELIAFCGAAMEKGYFPIAFANNPGWEGFHQYSMTISQMMGPDALRAKLLNNEGSWNTPEGITAIQSFFVDLNEAGCFPPDVNAIPYEDGNTLFFSGQSLLHTTGSWIVGDIEEAMGDYEIGYQPFPVIAEGNEPTWVSGVGSAYYITTKTEHADEAALLIDHLFSPPSVEKWVSEARYFVPVKVDLSAVEIGPVNRTVLDILQSAEAEGLAFGYNVDVLAPPPFNEMMQNGFQAVIAGDKTAEQQAADLDAAWNEGMPAS
ncbi:MAG: extracellular solute-binding protein [Chloroflexia bacterium]|nr:extracellular solute-binding protein [Chloroflexia bacterium]